MSLKSKLSRLQKQAGSGFEANVTNPASTNLRQRLTKLNAQRLHLGNTITDYKISDKELAERVKGSQIAEGVIQIRKRIPLTQRRGKFDLTGLGNRLLLPGESENANQRCVYLDTETTGLCGGSGTLAFIIGVAYVDEEVLDLRQYLLISYSGEMAMLSAVAEILSNSDKLVSYNGKSYDLPLLIMRFRMQSLPFPSKKIQHLDLLHPTRRLFSKHWVDCRLTTLEEKLLSYKRINDLSGAEAPVAWFNYLRHGLGAKLIKVVKHNQQDIISLAAAHIAIAQAIEEPQAFAVDLVGLARWMSESGEEAARILLDSHADCLCSEGKGFLAHLCGRSGDWSRAVEIWESLAIEGCTKSAESLAKYYEHKSKDFNLALHYCAMLPASTAQAHRLNRLKEKLERKKVRKNDFLSL